MRTLSRPMFNMGGPIKQGIMHGIREPKKHGGSMSESQGKNLVGDPVYPKTDGRAHHAIFGGAGIATVAGLSRLAPWAMRTGARYLPKIKSIFGTTTPASVTRGVNKTIGPMNYSPVTINPAKFNPNWLGRDPLVRGIGWAGKSIFNPTTGGLAAKALRFATAPSSIIAGVAYYMWPDGTEKTTPPPTGTGGVPGGGDPGMTYTSPEKKELSDAQKKAFATRQRNERVEKYLAMMGYDRSKKTAIADALIDASKIVSDRGTLDRKNITAELINPIIQATSKRLDKPAQIREAVGLMATKAEIEKDLSKETDALKTKALELQIAGAENTLAASQSFEGGLGEWLSSRKGAVGKAELTQIARVLANKHGDSFTEIKDITKIPEGGNGIYMVGSEIFRVTDGNAQQLA